MLHPTTATAEAFEPLRLSRATILPRAPVALIKSVPCLKLSSYIYIHTYTHTRYSSTPGLLYAAHDIVLCYVLYIVYCTFFVYI